MLQYVLLLTLLNGTHHFAQQTVQVDLQFNGIQTQQVSSLRWQLTWENQQVISDAILTLKQNTAHVKFELPKVRARTVLQWQYQWFVDGKVVQQDRVKLFVYPRDTLHQDFGRFKAMSLVLISGQDGLGKLLTAEGVASRTCSSFNQVGLKRPDYLLVDSQYVSHSAFALTPRIEQLVRSGTQVVIFANDKLRTMTNLPVALQTLKPTQPLEWTKHHPLLHELYLDDWLVESQKATVLQLDVEQPVQELVWLKAPEESQRLDSLVTIEQMGKGRIIYWQLPMGDWQTDPRAQQVLVNCLGYLASPITPTPSRKIRNQNRPQTIKSAIPTIHYNASN